MSSTQFEQARIRQLTSTYAPDDVPVLALDFGDYLSVLWRLDHCTEQPKRARYYRRCLHAMTEAFGIQGRSICRLVDQTGPGDLYQQLPNTPYRGTIHLVDALDRKAAIAQLAELRSNILRIGATSQGWGTGWPGNGILDEALRERIFAVLFTALQGQFGSFGRLLLVIDIVLANLLLGFESVREITLDELVTFHRYPDPNDSRWQKDFYGDSP
jgi:hypothetical protein